jgi:succinyl-diaminopimelate desuccinylase
MGLGKVLTDISEDRLVALTKDLVAIPSENPPGNEAEVARYIAQFFEGRGMHPTIAEKTPGRPNVIVHLQGVGKKPTLLLTGHTDVVPAGSGWSTDPYQPVAKDGKIFGRGTCDMKGGLACILHVMELLQKHNVPLSGDLVCAFTVAEETGGAEGAEFVVEERLVQADMGVLLEPSDFELVLAEEGVLWVRLTTRGTTTHTLNAATAHNAVEHMTLILAALMKQRSAILSCGDRGGDEPILSVNTIQGGDKPNVIPGECQATIDIRIPPECDLSMESAQARFSDVLTRQKEAIPGLDVDVQFDVVARAFHQPRDAEIVGILADCAEEVLGVHPEIVGPVPSTDEDSDAYHFWTKGQIPTVYFGPGKIEQAHAANEHIEILQLVQATQILTRVVFDTVVDSSVVCEDRS